MNKSWNWSRSMAEIDVLWLDASLVHNVGHAHKGEKFTASVCIGARSIR